MRSDDSFLTETRRERLFSVGNAELCGAAIEIMGMRKVPDATKAYMQFQISRGLQIHGDGSLKGVTAWRTGQHPRTIEKSHRSMIDQVLNRNHETKANDPDRIARDHHIGSVVGVEYPQAPAAGWKLKAAQGHPEPQVRGVAVIHKRAEGVPKILGEHLGGRHKWMVSQELHYSLADSGFLVPNLAMGTKKQTELCAGLAPEEMSGMNCGYVSCLQAPDELLEAYDPQKRRVDKKWGNLDVVLVNGGLEGENHYMGVGMVRYGAERDADIQTMLARDPDALDALTEDGVVEFMGTLADLAEGIQKIIEQVKG